MSAKRISEIKEAIALNDVSKARKLISIALKDQPDADIYYLASLVALDDTQKSNFLDKALELDPFHEEANNLLESNQSSSKFNSDTQSKTNALSKNHQKNNLEKSEEANLSKEETAFERYLDKIDKISFSALWWQRMIIGLVLGLILAFVSNALDTAPDAIPVLVIIGGFAGLLAPPKMSVSNMLISGITIVFVGFAYWSSIPDYQRGWFGRTENTSTEKIAYAIRFTGIIGILIGTALSRFIYWRNSVNKQKSGNAFSNEPHNSSATFTSNWKTWRAWIGFSTIGIILAFGVLPLNSILDTTSLFFIGIEMGFVLGLTQWFFIRKYVSSSAWWILISALSMGVGIYVTDNYWGVIEVFSFTFIWFITSLYFGSKIMEIKSPQNRA